MKREKEYMPPLLKANSACLIHADTGRVLFQKNARQALPPASLTKMMTALIVMEEVKRGAIRLDKQVRVSRYASSRRGSTMKLRRGERITLHELMQGLMMASGNDAATALAESLAGTESEFVKRMNRKTVELELEGTHFTNPHGLSAVGHYSCAYDLAMIARALLQHRKILRYTSVRRAIIRKNTSHRRLLKNTNSLLGNAVGVDGVKTGYTPQAKYCLCASMHTLNGRFIAVVMGLTTKRERNQEAMKLLHSV
ncbi:D-alanyl-D-alanine carboxypeptidase [Aneurinibacillus sp. Ricciae_BoGa-3]|uniref:D-alanyl-D-alanine carboxypeptidase family protein n=1 Tax=Aneurinibacillus sp. Ricciae_BoGa-3 TaxID=3022697 RepID=UPI00233FCCB6|nr:D-alanyl-D-alanine carboxypeptidase family protein [Aneurinibacillus sp. Ricciae_BoGa-3]WCK52623.1 D-alanyl-D-alanine carboxypeptidase [Aneurinibacillus sp. Ricciae_BoGa-3]